MESKDILYKPKELYERQLKQQYHQAAEEYFNKLVKDTKTDADINFQHVKEYKELLSKQKEAENSVSQSSGLKAFFIVLAVFSFIGAFIFCLVAISNIAKSWWALFIMAALIGLAIFLIIYTRKNIDNVITQKQAAVEKLKQSADSKLNECYMDMQALNNAFDWSIPNKIMQRVTNIIELDPYFSRKRLNYLVEKFGFDEDGDDNESTLGILSGSIQGNPFVLKKTLTEEYLNKKYVGSMTITWETYSINSKGETVTHYHSEVLTASSVHKAPFYSTNTVLIYGNEAAPHLTFTHSPSNINQLNAKEREKEVKRKMKEINKSADKAVENGSSFVPTGNDEFDVFFGGLDRNNEVEFRLLFTPLAEKNMVELLSDPMPFGDDFHMIKQNMVNCIVSKHSQSFDYSASPGLYTSYDLTISRNAFVSYCDEFIKNLFFDLAPLLSIPLYQMHKPKEYIYEKEPSSNYSYCEHETIANSMDQNLFMPYDADPSLPVMIKSKSASKCGNVDRVHVHSYSYQTTPRVDYISVYGRDGFWHKVPVPWIEYDRVDDDQSFDLAYTGANKQKVNSKLCEENSFTHLMSTAKGAFLGRGMVSLLEDGLSQKDIDKLLKDTFQEKN